MVSFYPDLIFYVKNETVMMKYNKNTRNEKISKKGRAEHRGLTLIPVIFG